MRAVMAVVVGLAVAWSGVAFAQALPGQVDLQASYCLGVVEKRLEDSDKILQRPDFERSMRDPIAKIAAEDRSALSRLRQYIGPRLKFLDVTGLGAAKTQGQRDYAETMAKISQCSAACDSPSCLRSCKRDPLLGMKMERCDGLPFLPF
jgi:hypothetical protein